MAALLYRLGISSARHPWRVIGAWLSALALAVGAFVLFGGTLSTAISIPGTPTEEIGAQIAEGFPDAGAGASTVLFQTVDGEPFTEAQQAEVGATLAALADVDGVTGAVDPFATANEIETQHADVTRGLDEIAAARADVQAGLEQIATQRESLTEAGTLDVAVDALDAQQEELESALAELDAQEASLGNAVALMSLADGAQQISDDGATAMAAVQFNEAATTISEELKDAVKDSLADHPIDGVDGIPAGEISGEMPSIVGPGEIGGLLVAAIVLVVMLGTITAAGLPLIVALLGVAVGLMVSLSLSSVLDMMTLTPILGLMLGVAVGIDYALFIINRHRKQLRGGMEVQESIGLANGTSGNAVLFAGATVVTALLALNLVGISFLGAMGTVGAICVAVAIAMALTLTPALMGLAGSRLTPKAKERGPARAARKRDRGATPKQMTTRRAVLTIVGAVALLIVIAIPALDMRMGLNTSAGEPAESDGYRAYTLTRDEFGAGFNSPLVTVADMGEVVTDDALLAEQVRVGTALKSLDDVRAVVPMGASEDGTLLAFQLIPTEGPTEVSTEDLVVEIRDLELAGLDSFGVAGNASGNIDISEKVADALPIYLAVVVGFSLLILLVVFRSVLVPLTATLGFVLSLVAMFGGLTAVFQWGWLSGVFGINEPGPVLTFIPIVAIGVLFGLAMDYQLFLVSGMREAHVHGAPAREAVVTGLRAGRSVVVAAALIMVSVFSGFIFAESALVKSVGFALAFGVLLDAFVVRLLLIPAVMHLLGSAAWWLPAWLDRILPDVDVEGAALERSHPLPQADDATDEGDLVAAGSPKV
ncbi:MMPL family transporter [Demequina gelatinilytica]|uniref:MMPL family transporter n=1 Tax=Demequina gelatinilytica TaxID=1638980 RepID=UPI000784FD81|nr:MMPL family transporter [Demequina gelatinilytica]